MTVIEETETTSELKQVEQTTTVERVQCDVCGHAYCRDEWSGNEFSVNPGVEREVYTFQGLEDLFDVYYTTIPTHVVDDGYDGHEMNFDVPKKKLFEAIKEEAEVASIVTERTQGEQLSVESKKTDYADMIGSNNFYLVDGEIHHFKYVLNAEASTDDHKHVCDDCYSVIFE